MRRALHLLVLASLLVGTGAHTAVLQGAAWARMLAASARRGDLAAALAETFDGEHPCAMCLSIRASATNEALSAAPARSPLVFAAPTAAPAPSSGKTRSFVVVRAAAPSARDQAPPVPPPPASLS